MVNPMTLIADWMQDQPQLFATDKMCSRCGESKPLRDFARRKEGKDGYRGTCRPCYGTAVTRYRERHPERVRLREWRWRQTVDPQEHARKNRAWRAANRERDRANARRRRKQDPSKHIDQIARRRFATKDASLETIAFIDTLRHDPCAYCGAAMEQIDHIVPLADDGPHDWENLSAACRSCNQRKSFRSMLTFMLECRP